MASSSGNFSLSIKFALISAGVVSIAVILKIYVPAVTDFVVSEAPVMYSSFVTWLRPPYLYLVINGIIISIVASTKIQLEKPDESSKQPAFIHPPSPSAVVADKFSSDLSAEFTDERSSYEDLNSVAKFIECDNDEAAISSKTVPPSPPLRSESIEELLQKMEKEKPLDSERLGQIKSVNSSPEEWKRQETLENTWKMITDGRSVRKRRQLKKSETWDTRPGRPRREEKMKKSETFSENESKTMNLRKEASLSQEELNRRVEEFINKFNEEMRLQRQQSLNQYQQMISRGVY